MCARAGAQGICVGTEESPAEACLIIPTLGHSREQPQSTNPPSVGMTLHSALIKELHLLTGSSLQDQYCQSEQNQGWFGDWLLSTSGFALQLCSIEAVNQALNPDGQFSRLKLCKQWED